MTNLPRLLIILLCSIPCLALPVTAQTEVQPPVFPKPQPLPETEPLPPLEDLLPPPTTPPEQPEPSSDIPATVTVTQFNVEGSTVFSPEELASVLEPFTDRPLSFAQLLEAQQAITQLYFDKGYITSGAFIPPQEIADGVVTIQVIEGEVEEIKIEGLGHLKPGYIRSRVALGAKKPFNRNKLLNALQLLQLDPLIDKLDAELASGSRPGKSILTVKAIDADAFSLQIGMDNQRSPSVGSTRRTLDIEHGNVFGIGDRFHVGYINTNGSNSLNDLSYTIPINPQNGTIGFSYSLSNSHIIEEPFDKLDIESNTTDYQLTYRQPILQTPNQELALGLTASRQESKTELLNEPFPLSAGADENGETKVSALRFFQDYTARDNRQVFALRSQYSFGIDAFDATTNEDLPDSNFFAWRGQAQYVRLLGKDSLFLLRSDLQLAADELLALEQFSAGGQQSVRGYRQDALLADNGLFLSTELRLPILRISKWDSVLQLTPFFDFATLWNNGDSDLEDNSLASVGLGLRFNVGDKFNARLDWGIPLTDLNDSEDKDTLQENGIYFQLEYRPF